MTEIEEKRNSYKTYKEELQNEKERKDALELKLEAMNLTYSWVRDRKEKQETKIALKALKETIKQKQEFIDKNTTFSMNDFLFFLIEFLKRTQHQPIVKPIFYQDYGKEVQGKKYKAKWVKKMLLNMEEEYYVIIKKRDYPKIKKLYRTHTLFECLEELNLTDYLLLPTDFEFIHLTDGMELKQEFSRFPEMQYLFERAIELSILDSKKTQKEKLEILLEEVIENQNHHWKRKREKK